MGSREPAPFCATGIEALGREDTADSCGERGRSVCTDAAPAGNDPSGFGGVVQRLRGGDSGAGTREVVASAGMTRGEATY